MLGATFFSVILSVSAFSAFTFSPIPSATFPDMPALRYRPFAAHDVRLLAGPFKRAQDLNREVLLSLEPDRLLAMFRECADLSPKAQPYAGWEAGGLHGHMLGHYLSACASLWAATGDKTLETRIDYVLAELKACQAAHGDGYVLATPQGKTRYRQLANGHIEVDGFKLNGIWSPLYSAHKLLAGLRDVYHILQKERALTIAQGLGEFFLYIFGHITEKDMQRILAVEHGGMMEVLADLAAYTGDLRFLELARRFHHRAILDPLIEGKDILSGRHANTQGPKLVGLARLFELTGDSRYRAGASFFWDRVVNHHTYCTGSCSEYEYFGAPDCLNHRLSHATGETCIVYNMLKLTALLFAWDGRIERADYYERALVNHILASQHPDSGWTLYYLSLAMGGGKSFDDPTVFTCCVGTGLENHSRYGEGIYYHSDTELVVNQLIASRLQWQTQGLTLIQECDFPESTKGALQFRCARPVDFNLKLRYPYWAYPGAKLTLNGEPIPVASEPGSYICLRRTWQNGDRLGYDFQRRLALDPLPDNPTRAAIRFGPMILGGDLEPKSGEILRGPEFVPVLVTGRRPPAQWLQTLAVPNEFRLQGVGHPRDVNLVPLYRFNDRRYTVYWDFLDGAVWEQRQRENRDLRIQQRRLDARTVDLVHIGNQGSETAHNLQSSLSSSGHGPRGGFMWRHADPTGWFSYDLEVERDTRQVLRLRYWGDEKPPRTFDILVNDFKIAEQRLHHNNPRDYFTVDYPLSDDRIQGRSRITVRIQAHENSGAGGIYEVRVLRAK